MQNLFNFSAGPAMLPQQVLRIAQKELCSFHNTGMSIMEISHRNPIFEQVHNEALSNFRKLLNINEDYCIIFMQGGAIAQNSLIPMNLLGNSIDASYAVTGAWSHKSAIEAKKYGNIHIACFDQPFLGVPDINSWEINQNSTYLHVCTNETIDGIEFLQMPKTKIPIIADMSSHILSRQIIIEDFGVIYGGAQKNIGPSGLTFSIIKKDLLNKSMSNCPSALNWHTVYENNSMYNTPPTFAIYMAGLVFKWILEQGGVEAIEKLNIQKSNNLYEYIDSSNFYENNIDKVYRSRMNIPFQLKNHSLNQEFLDQAEKNNLFGLKGHKSVGGMRASIYNAMPMQGVEKLINFMHQFAKYN